MCIRILNNNLNAHSFLIYKLNLSSLKYFEKREYVTETSIRNHFPTASLDHPEQISGLCSFFHCLERTKPFSTSLPSSLGKQCHSI